MRSRWLAPEGVEGTGIELVVRRQCQWVLEDRVEGDLLDDKRDTLGLAIEPQLVVVKERSARAAGFVIERERIRVGFDRRPPESSGN